MRQAKTPVKHNEIITFLKGGSSAVLRGPAPAGALQKACFRTNVYPKKRRLRPVYGRPVNMLHADAYFVPKMCRNYQPGGLLPGPTEAPTYVLLGIKNKLPKKHAGTPVTKRPRDFGSGFAGPAPYPGIYIYIYRERERATFL